MAGVPNSRRIYEQDVHERNPIGCRASLWAWDFKEPAKPMQDYVEKLEQSHLTDVERLSLHTAEGKWPDYPLAIQKLARDHRFSRPPWETALTGSPERWDEYSRDEAAVKAR